MEIKDALIAALEGESILFVGSGFSLGAKNSDSSSRDMNGVGGLMKKLGDAIGVKNPNDYTLGRLSDSYIKRKGASELITLLKQQFKASEICDSHKKICSCDWIRVYTTNYDDVVKQGFASEGKVSTSITLHSDYQDFRGQKGLIVHLNGYINSVTEDKLGNEFKLTNTSYITEEFNNSAWVQMFRNDLRVCKSIFFVGFSMGYDLDLARIIAMSSIKEKAFFVVAKDCPDIEKEALEDYGKVLPIELTGLVEELLKVKKIYSPKVVKMFNPSCFSELSLSKTFAKVRSEDFNSLLLMGEIRKDLIQASLQDSSVSYVVNRKVLLQTMSLIEKGVKNFVVESALGNGKTIFLHQLACSLMEKGRTVFWYEQSTEKIHNEILTLSQLYPDAVVILDDYHTAKDVMDSIRKTSPSIVIVTSERQALHDAVYEDIQMVLGNYETISVDRLRQEEKIEVERLFDTYSIWGDMTTATKETRIAYIDNICHSQLSSLILSRVKSSNIISKLRGAYAQFKDNKDFRRVFIIALINEFYRLKVDVFDFASWAGADVINSPSFRNNLGIKEFLDTKNDMISLRSSIIAHHFLSEMDSKDCK